MSRKKPGYRRLPRDVEAEFLKKRIPDGLPSREELEERENERRQERKTLLRVAGFSPLPSPAANKSKPSSGSKPGSAAAWIDKLCPNGEWRLKTAKQL
jgi:hypothetical protein